MFLITFITQLCLDWSVLMSLVWNSPDLVLPTMKSRSLRIVLDLDRICSIFSSEGIPTLIYQRKQLNYFVNKYLWYNLLKRYSRPRYLTLSSLNYSSLDCIRFFVRLSLCMFYLLSSSSKILKSCYQANSVVKEIDDCIIQDCSIII